MKKLLLIIPLLFLLTSCDGIQQEVSYRYDEYQIQTWNNWHHYNAVIYTNDEKHLDSLKGAELLRAKNSIKKLKKLNKIAI